MVVSIVEDGAGECAYGVSRLVAKVARPRPPHLLRSRRKRTSWTKDFMLIPAGR